MPPLTPFSSKPDQHERYDRFRDLPRLIGIWPRELVDTTDKARRQLCCRLATALRLERQRGCSGDVAYDLGRHAALLSAYRSERAALRTKQWPESGTSITKLQARQG